MMTTRSVGSSEEAKFKGVRKRKWGKWVSEVRLPNSRERIWLGSYDSPEKAARAFDAAAFCLRGQRARLNFPNNLPAVPSTGPLTCLQIQELAAVHAHSVETAVETTTTTIATAADAEETERATSSENSPSEEVDVAGAATAIDWSFLDVTNGGFHSMIDDFGYDHFLALLSPTVGPTDGTGEEGTSGCGTSSSLWNF